MREPVRRLTVPRTLALDPDHVEVVDVELSATGDALEHLLSPAEHARADRLARARDRARFVSGRATLRMLLGACLGVPPADVLLHRGRHGKPELDGAHALDLRFNLSHSGDRALVALGLGRALGIDIERITDDVEGLAIAATFFAPLEAAALAAVDPAQRRAAFYRSWTRKESFLKARGDGLAFPLDAVDGDATPDALRGSWLDRDGAHWRVESLDVGLDHAAALTAEAGRWIVRRWSARRSGADHLVLDAASSA